MVHAEEKALENQANTAAMALGEILDVPAIQAMMDASYALTKIGIGIIDVQGNVLVATGWQDICTKFHRQHPETCRHCLESDTVLTANVEPGTFKMYRCQNGMWDIVTPIVVTGKHVGNLFLGQFLFDDETPDYEAFRTAARRYGFDEMEYLAALDRVPRWSRDTVNRAMEFYTHFANMVASLSFNNNRLQQIAVERTQDLMAANVEMKALNDDLERRVREIKETNSLLERSNADLEQFAYVASHDLQEPLRQISSFSQLLARRYVGKLDADADDFIGFVVDGTKRMQELINDVLVYARLRKKEHQFDAVACEALFTEVLLNLQMAVDESQAQITHDPLPVVTGDRMQLAQLFRNLLSNAIKFRSEESPRIHVGVEKQKNQWLFSVRDNGIGIAATYFERIFVVFQRLHSRAEYPGTGIGLAICKRVVGNHGGEIWVTSEAGKGTTFWFTLHEKGR